MGKKQLVTSSATEMYASSSMPPAARACLPERLRKQWPDILKRFEKYVSGGITSHRSNINSLDEKRMELWKQLREREKNNQRGKVSEVEIKELLDTLSANFMHYTKYSHEWRTVSGQKHFFSREFKRIIKDNTAQLRETVEKLAQDIQDEHDEIRAIREAPETIVMYMSWLEWYRTLEYDEMQEEIRRIENKLRSPAIGAGSRFK